VPYSLSERLGPYGRRDLDVTIHEEPQWWMVAGIVTAGVVTIMAIAAYFGAREHIRSPTTLAVLLAVAIIPFFVQLKVEMHSLLFCLWPVLAIGALQLFGDQLGTYEPVHGSDQVSLMIIVWAVGATASVAPRREVVIVTIAALGIVFGREFTDQYYNSSPIWAVGVAIAFLAGLFIRSLTVALLNTKLAEAVVKKQAVTAERQRIAREVHDVIAHSMTVTMLHLTAARLAVGRGDNAAATEALEEAERAGRTSLTEIRNTVGLLRTEDGDAVTGAPQPTATDVVTLVAGYRAAGMDVRLDVDGDLATAEPTFGLTLYRVVQESLTNASRHAPGSECTVHVAVGPPLRVGVRNNGGETSSEGGSGMGLTGMAERVQALGGSFAAGPTPGGLLVEATLA